MSHIDQEVFELSVECSCDWVGAISRYRAHLVHDHCNVEGCGKPASALVSFGYRNPAFVMVGDRMGICAAHRANLRSGSMHMIVEQLRAPARSSAPRSAP